MKTPEYITIKEATERTGKHADTIRAFIKAHGIKTAKNPQGRVLVPVEALSSFYELKQEGSTKNTQETVGEATEQAHKVEVKHSEDVLIELLRKELEEKNKQIERQQQTIDDMQKTLTNLVNQQQQLSGALMLNAKNETSEDPEETPTEQATEAVKKKRFGLFGRKK